MASGTGSCSPIVHTASSFSSGASSGAAVGSAEEQLLSIALRLKLGNRYRQIIDALMKLQTFDMSTLQLVIGNDAPSNNDIVELLQAFVKFGFVKVVLSGTAAEASDNTRFKDIMIQRCDDRIMGCFFEVSWVDAITRWFGAEAGRIVAHLCSKGMSTRQAILQAAVESPNGLTSGQVEEPTEASMDGSLRMLLKYAIVVKSSKSPLFAELPNASALTSSKTQRTTSPVSADDKDDDNEEQIFELGIDRLDLVLWFDAFLQSDTPPLCFCDEERTILRFVFEICILSRHTSSQYECIANSGADLQALTDRLLESDPSKESQQCLMYIFDKFSCDVADAKAGGDIIIANPLGLFVKGTTRPMFGRIAKMLFVDSLTRFITTPIVNLAPRIFRLIVSRHPYSIHHSTVEKAIPCARGDVSAALTWLYQQGFIGFLPESRGERERFKGFRNCSLRYFVDLPALATTFRNKLNRQLMRVILAGRNFDLLLASHSVSARPILCQLLAVRIYLRFVCQSSVTEATARIMGANYAFSLRPKTRARKGAAQSI